MTEFKINNNAFLEGFFFVFGFQKNPFYNNARKVLSQTVEKRISDYWKETGATFDEQFNIQECAVNEQAVTTR